MPLPLQRFHAYEIAEDPGGTALELGRTDREVVCLASLPSEQRWVELHVLAGVDTTDPGSAPSVEWFRAQVHTLKRLRERRILEVLEAGEDEGALFYVSEFVDGETLDVYLARCTPVPPWWAVEIARQLTLGLLALRASPDLLARTQVFNARLTLEGEATSDALIKLADFELGGPPPPTAVSQPDAEARAVREVGRLLCYAATGSVAEPSPPRQFTRLPLPSELASLLERLLARPGRPAPADLPGLLAALTAASLSPSLAAAPPRLPPALRPRLPLAPHFPTLPRLATEVGPRFRLERTPFDAALPYSQRGFEGTAAVTVQLLPPARLLAPGFLPALRHAANRGAARPSPHLLQVLEVPAFDEAGWFLEEGSPRLTLDRARRLRRHLTPPEAAFLLREYDRAVLAVESRGLSPVAVAPQEVFFDFSGGFSDSPGDDELATRPVHSWPPFKLKIRAHPTAVHLAQARRFLRDRLLDPPPPRPATDPAPGPPAGFGSPSAGDYAALFAWMCGGVSAVPAELSALIEGALKGSALTRPAVVDAVTPFIPRPPKPSPIKSKPAASSSKKPPAPAAKRPAKSRRAQTQTPSDSPSQQTAARAVVPAITSVPMASPAVLDEHVPGFLPLSAAQAWMDDGGAPEDQSAGGFAEVLLGAETEHAPAGCLIEGPLYADPDDSTAPLPVGALFGTGPSSIDPGNASPEPTHVPRLQFTSGTLWQEGAMSWRLIILIVLAALTIAIVTAHFTGLGFWRS